jgi:hypothetical protein
MNNTDLFELMKATTDAAQAAFKAGHDESSSTIARQAKVIATLQHENELLRAKLNERANFDIAADATPSLLQRQAG